jgi:ferredoxin-type protein NapF
MAIFNGFFSLFTENVSVAVIISFMGLPVLLILSWFFPGIWCVKLCPLGGLQDEIAGLRLRIGRAIEGDKSRMPAGNQGRRFFLASGAGLLLGLVIPRFLKERPGKYFRPPSSLPQNLFNTLCIRCGSCIKVCPSHIIIHHKDPDDPASWMTPEVTFSNNGYCIEDCNMCSVVCPSGAITQFSREAKKHIFMATAVVHLDNCLLMEHEECDRCKNVCSYNAITIEFDSNNLTSYPLVDTDKCVGCGACAVICPPRTIEMIPL